MTLTMAREAWTDERLDDLNGRVASIDRRVEAGFAEMREEFRAVRSELGGQISALHRSMMQLFLGMIVTLVLGFGGMVVAIATQT